MAVIQNLDENFYTKQETEGREQISGVNRTRTHFQYIWAKSSEKYLSQISGPLIYCSVVFTPQVIIQWSFSTVRAHCGTHDGFTTFWVEK
jgi:hypothetical protein